MKDKAMLMMDMPNTCRDCPFLDDNGDYPMCIATHEIRGYNFRISELKMNKCPLKELPKDSVVLTKAEKQKLLHEMYEQGRFDALADIEKEGKVVLAKEEYKKLCHLAYFGYDDAYEKGGQDTAKDILNGLECFFWETAINDTKNFDLYQNLYRDIKDIFKNKYGVTKEN